MRRTDRSFYAKYQRYCGTEQWKLSSPTFFLRCAGFLVASAGEAPPPFELLLPPEEGRVGLGRAACRFYRGLKKIKEKVQDKLPMLSSVLSAFLSCHFEVLYF